MTDEGVSDKSKKVDEDWKRRVAEEKQVQDAAPPPASKAPKGSPAAPPGGSPGTGPGAPRAAAGKDAGPGTAPRSDPRFLQFLQGIAAQALMALGQIEGLPAPDLRQAKMVIDTLVMLQEKTEGNLTREEVQSLKGLIQELQSIYVQMAT